MTGVDVKADHTHVRQGGEGISYGLQAPLLRIGSLHMLSCSTVEHDHTEKLKFHDTRLLQVDWGHLSIKGPVSACLSQFVSDLRIRERRARIIDYFVLYREGPSPFSTGSPMTHHKPIHAYRLVYPDSPPSEMLWEWEEPYIHR